MREHRAKRSSLHLPCATPFRCSLRNLWPAVRFSPNCFGRFIKACILSLRLKDAALKGIPIQKPTSKIAPLPAKFRKEYLIFRCAKQKFSYFFFHLNKNYINLTCWELRASKARPYGIFISNKKRANTFHPY